MLITIKQAEDFLKNKGFKLSSYMFLRQEYEFKQHDAFTRACLYLLTNRQYISSLHFCGEKEACTPKS
jgi:hypothetical protein